MTAGSDSELADVRCGGRTVPTFISRKVMCIFWWVQLTSYGFGGEGGRVVIKIYWSLWCGVDKAG